MREKENVELGKSQWYGDKDRNYYVNGVEQPFRVDVETSRMITGIKSDYQECSSKSCWWWDRDVDDRKFGFEYRKVVDETHFPKESEYWVGESRYQADAHHKCETDHFFQGIKSHYTDKDDDRKFDVLCTKLRNTVIRVASCEWTAKVISRRIFIMHARAKRW